MSAIDRLSAKFVLDIPKPHPDCEEFQTRSEQTGLRFFTNLEDACKHCLQDTSVWKLSYQGLTGRVRLVLSD